MAKKRTADGEDELGADMKDAAPAGHATRTLKSKIRVRGRKTGAAEKGIGTDGTAGGAKNNSTAHDCRHDAEVKIAGSAEPNGRAGVCVKPVANLRGHAGEGDGGFESGDCNALVSDLISFQRSWVDYVKTIRRNRQAAVSALLRGKAYSPTMPEKERKKLHNEASKALDALLAGKHLENGYGTAFQKEAGFITCCIQAVSLFSANRTALEKEMRSTARQLPVWQWAEGVRGFAELSLAHVIGETGDLSNYANPAKVVKRMACAPIKGAMPATHRSKGTLTAAEWTDAGYCPRRRSVMFNVSECFVKAGGPFREYYDRVKAESVTKHPDWSKGHHNNHAKLLAAKRLLIHLWCAWNGKPIQGG